MAEEKKPIVISASDIQSGNNAQIVDHMQKAKAIPLVREIGDVNQKSNDGIITILVLTAAGVVGGLLALLFTRLMPQFDDTTTSNLVFSFTMTLAIAIALVSGDAALSRSAPKFGLALAIAGPAAIGLALVLGFVASSIYSTLVESTWNSLTAAGLDPYWDSDAFMEEFQNRNHLNRGLAWSFIGLAAGAAVGSATKSIKRVGITGAGGLVGGFIGGFLFDFFQGEVLAQLVGLTLTGAAIGLTVSLLEQAVKSSWLEIVSGGMAGKQFIIYQNEVQIGSSPSAHITLIKDPSIPPIAAVLRRTGGVFKVIATTPGQGIQVNDQLVTQADLKEGAVIVLGSTVLRFRERAKEVKHQGIYRG
jgi:hypothetical protein